MYLQKLRGSTSIFGSNRGQGELRERELDPRIFFEPVFIAHFAHSRQTLRWKTCMDGLQPEVCEGWPSPLCFGAAVVQTSSNSFSLCLLPLGFRPINDLSFCSLFFNLLVVNSSLMLESWMFLPHLIFHPLLIPLSPTLICNTEDWENTSFN